MPSRPPNVMRVKIQQAAPHKVRVPLTIQVEGRIHPGADITSPLTYVVAQVFYQVKGTWFVDYPAAVGPGGKPATANGRRFTLDIPYTPKYLGRHRIRVVAWNSKAIAIATFANVATTCTYNMVAANAALNHTAATTAAQVQGHLETIPALAGKIAVAGNAGGPYTVRFLTNMNPALLVVPNGGVDIDPTEKPKRGDDHVTAKKLVRVER